MNATQDPVSTAHGPSPKACLCNGKELGDPHGVPSVCDVCPGNWRQGGGSPVGARQPPSPDRLPPFLRLPAPCPRAGKPGLSPSCPVRRWVLFPNPCMCLLQNCPLVRMNLFRKGGHGRCLCMEKPAPPPPRIRSCPEAHISQTVRAQDGRGGGGGEGS